MKPFILGLCTWLVALFPSAQDASRSIAIGERFSIHSAILGEERPYWVYVPVSYRATRYAPRHYPVLYLLDGDANFYSATGTVQFMSSGVSGSIQIPELIIVAVLNTDRTRDLTPTRTLRRPGSGDDPSLKNSGGGDAFLKFLNDELIPHVDRTFRTSPYRVIVGHSFGGLLALHALQSAPHMFQGYIAIDPSVFWDNQVLVSRTTERPINGDGRPRAVYLSLSKSYADGYAGDAATKFAKHLETRTTAGVRSTLQHFPNEVHQSVAHIALYHGLGFLFDGYKLTPGQMFEQPSQLRAHFDEMSTQLGLDTVHLLPPEQFIDQVAHAFLGAGQVDKAIELFKFNVSGHPTSFNAYDSLAQAYSSKGDIRLAIENYETSLRLNPDNQDARKRLENLRNR
jgi:predicted alpha/beta superfamily hydrolase